MSRYFEKISFEQFKKDVKDDRELYDSFPLPCRKTINAAGYDFELLEDIVLQPGERRKFPTGIKSRMESGDMLLLLDRGSTGTKYNLRMCNQVGVIDADYYNNIANEGHLFYMLQNEGKETFVAHKGECLIQGIFTTYLLTDDDNCQNSIRVGGFGSTNKKEKE